MFTRLGELTGHARWTERATATADALLALFHDDRDGGFFTTGHDAEPLIVRTKDVFDGATSSANAVAAGSLARLGALTGDDRYTVAAREVVDLLGDLLIRHPTAFAQTVLTADPSHRRMHRSGDHRVAPGPPRGGPDTVAPRFGAGLGRTDLVAAVAGPGLRQGLRVPELRRAGCRPATSTP